MHGREKEIVKGFGGKIRRKDICWKTETWMEEWDRNGSEED
jgi:hypothetical protein